MRISDLNSDVCSSDLHDPELYARRMPSGDVAPMLYEALEQARVEALGARRMPGVGENLAAAMEQRYRRQGLHRVTDRTEATMPEVVRLKIGRASCRERVCQYV